MSFLTRNIRKLTKGVSETVNKTPPIPRTPDFSHLGNPNSPDLGTPTIPGVGDINPNIARPNIPQVNMPDGSKVTDLLNAGADNLSKGTTMLTQNADWLHRFIKNPSGTIAEGPGGDIGNVVDQLYGGTTKDLIDDMQGKQDKDSDSDIDGEIASMGDSDMEAGEVDAEGNLVAEQMKRPQYKGRQAANRTAGQTATLLTS